jgi:hypothetical protein
MTARVVPMRSLPAGKPCGSGTVPGGVSEPCGRTDTRQYAAGWRCAAHPPPSAASLRSGSMFDVPALQAFGEAA